MNEISVVESFLVIAISVWCVYRIFILTKRMVKGWGKR